MQYYRSSDQKRMAVVIGPGRSFGAPTGLLLMCVAEDVNSQRRRYAPSGDGKQLLINVPTSDAAIVPITVVLNSMAALKN